MTLGLLLLGAAAAGSASAAPPEPPAYYPSGPQMAVDTTAPGVLDGWAKCFESGYSGSESLASVLSACDGPYLLLASGPAGSTTYDVLAAAPRDDVTFDTGDGASNTHNANGTEWYYSQNTSWGFAGEGDLVARTTCDTWDIGSPEPDRLCWHTSGGSLSSGWRSGANLWIYDNSYTRYIYEPAEALNVTVNNDNSATTANGSVTGNIGSIDCPAGACSDPFNWGDVVTLTAHEGANTRFMGWSGDCAGSGLTCDVTMDQARKVAADFITTKNLHVVVNPSGTRELLTNGGFEAGDFTGWTATDVTGPLCNWAVLASGGCYAGSYGLPNVAPIEGSMFANNGFDGNGPGDYVLYQDVVIPPASTVSLSWNERVAWDMTVFGATQPRTASVEIRDPNTNALLDTPNLVTAPAGTSGDTGWTPHSVDLSAYAGETIRLQFRQHIPEPFTGPASYSLDGVSVAVTGIPYPGTGSVSDGTNVCTGTCDWTEDEGTTAHLTATPDAGNMLLQWGMITGGACTGDTASTCDVSMDADRSAEADFAVSYDLDVSVNNDVGPHPATGSVTSSESIDCPGTCSEPVAKADPPRVVTLTIHTPGDTRFLGWSGDCSGKAPTCDVTMDQVRNVGATFVKMRNLDVSVSNTGPVSGAVQGGNNTMLVTTSYGAVLGVLDLGTGTITPSGSPINGGSEYNYPVAIDPATGKVFTVLDDFQYSGPSMLATIDRSTGIATPIAPVSAPALLSLAFSPDGTLYGLTYSWYGSYGPPVLYTVDTATGATTPVGNTGLAAATDMTFNSAGDLFAVQCTDDELYKIDPATAATGSAGTMTGLYGGNCKGIAVDSNDDFVVVEFQSGNVFRVDPGTLAATLIGNGGQPYPIGLDQLISSIDCPGTCSAKRPDVVPADTMYLHANTPAGARFVGWTGTGCTGTDPDCIVTLDQDQAPQANFMAIWDLNVTVNNAGSTPSEGSVTSDVGGIDCPSGSCMNAFDHDTVVTLTAHVPAGDRFVGWSGDCAGSDTTCQVTMDQAHDVTADFIKTWTITVTKSGSGGGTVSDGTIPLFGSGDPTGLDCGATCQVTVDDGTEPVFGATPDATSTFNGFTGMVVSSGVSPGTRTCLTFMTSEACLAGPIDGDTTITADFTRVKFGLDVSKTGTGGGTVSSSPSGIACGPDCSAHFDATTAVTLTATPNAASDFTGWSGSGCTGTGTCVVTIDGLKSVSADFGSATRTLDVAVDGTGGGSVASSPVGIDCPGTCSHDFAKGTAVKLTASPAAGSSFVGWSGPEDCDDTDKACWVNLDSSKSMTATFDTKPVLTIAKAGTGNGAVTTNPSGIGCGSTCSAAFEMGTLVTLTADPGPSSTFAGWTGDCVDGSTVCVVTMDAAKNVTATFDGPPSLTVTTAGTGEGTVTSNPVGINCGSTCSASYAMGTPVALTAAADPGSMFEGWSGDCTGTGACIVTMDAARDVTATFTALSYQPDAWIQIGSGAVIGDGIYSASAAGESVTGKVKVGKKVTVNLTFQNDGGPLSDVFKLSGPKSNKVATIAYATGGTDITSQVTGGTYKTPSLAPGASFTMQVTVTGKKAGQVAMLIGATSMADGAKVDAVKATITVK